MTSLPAQILSIDSRGLIKEGYYADITIFDASTVIDKASFEDPHQYALGVHQVWVNGIQVIENGEPTGATPGRFVRGPGWQPKVID